MDKKIGLIEDDKTMLALLQTLFSLEGYQPIVFPLTTLPEIEAEIVQHELTALLIDVHLKSFSGIDLTKRIRSHTEIHQPVILMASGMDLSAECQKAGADQFFLKPYMPQTLIDWLKNRLQKQDQQ